MYEFESFFLSLSELLFNPPARDVAKFKNHSIHIFFVQMIKWVNLKRIKHFILINKKENIIILGFILRFILSFLAYHPFDLPLFFIASLDVIEGTDPFRNIRYAYPPLYLYLLSIILYPFIYFLKMSNISFLTFDNSPENLKFLFRISPIYPNHIVSFLMEIPNIIFSTACIWLIYEITFFYNKDKEASNKAAFLWSINPTILFLNVMWGLPDPIVVFLILLGLYYLLVKENYNLAIISFSLSFSIKLYPIVFFISTIILIYFKTKNIFKISKLILLYIFISLIILIPSIFQNSLIFFGETGYQATKRLGTLNVFILFNYLPFVRYSPILSPFIHWFFSIIGFIIGIFWLIRVKYNPLYQNYIIAFLTTEIIYYLLVTWYTPPHCLILLALLIIFIYTKQNKSLIKWAKYLFLIMSIVIPCMETLNSNLFTMYLIPSTYIFGQRIENIISFADKLNSIPYFLNLRIKMMHIFSLIFNSTMIILSFMFFKDRSIND